jgi:hypothetical protein
VSALYGLRNQYESFEENIIKKTTRRWPFIDVGNKKSGSLIIYEDVIPDGSVINALSINKTHILNSLLFCTRYQQ